MSTAVFTVGMLITGSINTISKKIQNNVVGTGMNGQESKFHYPYTQTLFMFIGEFLCLAIMAVMQNMARKKERQLKEAQPLLNDGKEVGLSEMEKLILNPPKIEKNWLILTTWCDLMGTTLAGIGLVYTNASVFQMLRASIILFVALLRRIFRKKRLAKFQLIGLSIVFVALVLVGLSSFLNANAETNKKESDEVLLGDFLILIGMFFSATQMVLEESFVQTRNYHPLQVVGFEGLFGIIGTICVMLPIVWVIPGHDHGSYEHPINAFILMSHSALLLTMIILYTCSIAFYNWFGLMVTRRLSTIHRTLIDSLRTICVWCTMLLVYYCGAHSIGERWGPYSYIQFIGFSILVCGSMIYYDVIKLPFPFHDFAAIAATSAVTSPNPAINNAKK